MGQYNSGAEFLQAVRSQYKRYRMTAKEMEEYWIKIAGAKAVRYDREKLMGGRRQDVSDLVIKLDQYERCIAQELAELLKMRIHARYLICQLGDEESKAVLCGYYLDNRTQEEIASILYMSRQSVGLKLQEAVTQFNKIYAQK